MEANSSLTPFSPAFNHLLAIKLDSPNFLLWKQQIIADVHGHKLMEFILSAESTPEKFTNDGRLTLDFIFWDQ